MKTRLWSAVIAVFVLLSLGLGAAVPAGAATGVGDDQISYRPKDLVVPNSVLNPVPCTGVELFCNSLATPPPAWSVSECTTSDGLVKSYCADYAPGGPKDCSVNILDPNSWGCRKSVVIPEDKWRDIVNAVKSTRPKSAGGNCTYEATVAPGPNPNEVLVSWIIKSVDELYYGSDPVAAGLCIKRPREISGMALCKPFNTASPVYQTGPSSNAQQYGPRWSLSIQGDPFTAGTLNQRLCDVGDTLLVAYWWDPDGGWTSVVPGVFKNPVADLVPISESQSVMECKAPNGTITKITTTTKGSGTFSSAVCPANNTFNNVTNNVLVGGAVVNQGPTFQVQPNFNTQFALCAGNSLGQGCALDVKVDSEVCIPLKNSCTNWYETYEKQPSRVECYWGPYKMPMKDCLFMRYSYSTELGISTSTTTIINNNTYGNPMAPSGPLSLNTDGMFANPDPRNSSLTSSAVCFPSGWQKLNPVEWVLQPTRCALTWAFVPNQTTVKNLTTGLQTKMERVGFKPVSDAVGTAFASVGTGGGCKGPGINFDVKNVHKTLYLWDACAAPMSTVAGFSYAISSVTIVGAGGFALIRALGSGFGYRVSAGKGES